MQEKYKVENTDAEDEIQKSVSAENLKTREGLVKVKQQKLSLKSQNASSHRARAAQEKSEIKVSKKDEKYDLKRKQGESAQTQQTQNEKVSNKTEPPKYLRKHILILQKNEKAEQQARSIIESIDQAYQKDSDLFKKQKPATNKLKCITVVSKSLKEIIVAKYFVEIGGPLAFINWLTKDPETQQETCLTVKIELLKLILELVEGTDLNEDLEQLYSVIKLYRRSKFKELRLLSQEIGELRKAQRTKSKVGRDHSKTKKGKSKN